MSYLEVISLNDNYDEHNRYSMHASTHTHAYIHLRTTVDTVQVTLMVL